MGKRLLAPRISLITSTIVENVITLRRTSRTRIFLQLQHLQHRLPSLSAYYALYHVRRQQNKPSAKGSNEAGNSKGTPRLCTYAQ
jgi:hypothetical protein